MSLLCYEAGGYALLRNNQIPVSRSTIRNPDCYNTLQSYSQENDGQFWHSHYGEIATARMDAVFGYYVTAEGSIENSVGSVFIRVAVDDENQQTHAFLVGSGGISAPRGDEVSLNETIQLGNFSDLNDILVQRIGPMIRGIANALDSNISLFLYDRFSIGPYLSQPGTEAMPLSEISMNLSIAIRRWIENHAVQSIKVNIASNSLERMETALSGDPFLSSVDPYAQVVATQNLKEGLTAQQDALTILSQLVTDQARSLRLITINIVATLATSYGLDRLLTIKRAHDDYSQQQLEDAYVEELQRIIPSLCSAMGVVLSEDDSDVADAVARATAGYLTTYAAEAGWIAPSAEDIRNAVTETLQSSVRVLQQDFTTNARQIAAIARLRERELAIVAADSAEATRSAKRAAQSAAVGSAASVAAVFLR